VKELKVVTRGTGAVDPGEYPVESGEGIESLQTELPAKTFRPYVESGEGIESNRHYQRF